MTDNTLKQQRDRFLAFAFASADLMVEVSHEGRIIFAKGATKGLTGGDDKNLIGRNWLELFSPYEQTTIQSILQNARPGHRCGPLVMKLGPAVGGRKAIVTGIRMPDSGSYYLTIGFSSALREKIVEALQEEIVPEILEREDFIRLAQSTIRVMRENEETAFLGLADLSPLLTEARETLHKSEWERLERALEHQLLEHSIRRNFTGKIGDNLYAFLHNKSVSSDTVYDRLKTATKQINPVLSADAIKLLSIEADLRTIDRTETTWAITTAVSEFEKNPFAFDIYSLQGALEKHRSTKEHRLKELEGFIKRVSFTFAFQPIINLQNREIEHYEILCRFEGGRHTREWMNLATEEGLIADLDLAMAERASNQINFKDGGTTRKFSMNFSGQSIANANFREKFLARFDKSRDLARRLMFEITNVPQIEDTVLAAQFITDLKSMGFRVALDSLTTEIGMPDIAARLGADTVKISGQCARKLLGSAAEIQSYEEFVQKFSALGLNIIAKGLEKEEQALAVKNMGVPFGQGHLFGKPGPRPIFNVPKEQVGS